MSDISSIENQIKNIATVNENLKISMPSLGAVQSCIKDMKNLSMPQVIPQIAKPFKNDEFEKWMSEISQTTIQKHKRELENNKNLKALVEYNQQIANYNNNLVALNNKILNKINSLDDTLLFLNDAFKDKSQFDKEKQIDQNALLLELIKIVEEKDSSKLKTFMNNVGAPVAVGLTVEYLKMLIGIVN